MWKYSVCLLFCLFVVSTSSSCDCGSDKRTLDDNGGLDTGGDADLDALGEGDAEENGGNTDPNGDASGSSDGDGGNGGDAGNGGEEDAGTIYDDSCGLYQVECDGECIPASMDPDNCGGCGITCGDTEVCSGGQCVDDNDCPDGFSACDGRCTDTFWDNDHCGVCGHSCGDGMGCVENHCMDVIELGDAPDFCDDGGPQIEFSQEGATTSQCAADVAEFTFRWGLCSCDDITTNNPVTVDAYDSSLGPYTPGGPGGGVGTNGNTEFGDAFSVTGSFWSAGTQGLVGDDTFTIGQRLYAGGDLDIDENVTVGGNAYVVGDLILNGYAMDVGRTLHVSANSDVPDGVTYEELVVNDPQVGPACSACEEEARINVAAIVAAHQGGNNDNNLIGLQSDVLSDSAGNTRLELPCGLYYLDEITTQGPTTIVAQGNTALFVGGDITANNELTIALAPDAQFDVFVAGDMTTNNPFRLGSANYPALMRLYVGGSGGFSSGNEIEIGGYIYAVPGGFESDNEIKVYGGIFAQSFQSNNEINIHYDRRITTVGRQCPDDSDDPIDPVDPNDPDAGGGDDAGGEPDPDPEPQCSSSDDMCTSDADCCAPLECNDGTCSLLECQPTFGTCAQNTDCCSNVCGIISGEDYGICIVN